jgi:L-fucose isomerase-like protein
MGFIGYHAPGFIDMHPDPFLLNKTFGIQLQHMGIVEFMDTVNSQSEQNVASDLDVVRSLKLANKDIAEADLAVNSKYYLALKQIMAAESFNAFAIRCWPELPNVIGHWPYLALSRLVSEGVPLACEGDVDGALCALFAKHLNLGSVYLTDWLEHDRERITIWHGGMAPLDISQTPRLAKHFNSKKPMVVDAEIDANEPITLFRVWNCDNRYHLVAMEGETEKPNRPFMGSNGLARVNNHNLIEFFDDLCHMGMPHHLAIVRGHHKSSLKALARRFNITYVG